jgi:hypothetical protein
MSRFLAILAIIFFAVSLFEMYQMRKFLRYESAEGIRSEIKDLVRAQRNTQRAVTTAEVVQQSLLILEADGLDKRYRQATALLMSRIWTRQLAFITGVVLAFIGAVFIIGKLSENKTDANLGGAHWQAGISSTSPGLILGFFGTVLMAVALVVQPKIEVQDRPVHFMTTAVVRNPGAPGTVTAVPPIDPFDDAANNDVSHAKKSK